ncbi:MAG: pyridoxamine 5'-phosphate oxidase [Microbacteriaceae bacterium]|nr:pyridoxamine 5'-phosphate oxidase [Microbacteriaceae bacterium]
MSSFSEHQQYTSGELPDGALGPDPIAALEAWLADAEAAGLPDPNAMVVGTVEADGRPSSRTVLWKGVDAGRLAFFTNRESAKGLAIAHEARVSLLFPWYGLHRQVRVEGVAAFAPDELSDAYWATRPRGSQVGAWASEQSRPIGSRDELDARETAAEERFAGIETLPRPPHWGGYLVTPASIEFWQGRASRLHDRQLYERAGDGWRVTRLQP